MSRALRRRLKFRESVGPSKVFRKRLVQSDDVVQWRFGHEAVRDPSNATCFRATHRPNGEVVLPARISLRKLVESPRTETVDARKWERCLSHAEGLCDAADS